MTMENCGCVFSNEFLMETIKSLASVDFHGRHGSGVATGVTGATGAGVCARVCAGVGMGHLGSLAN